MNSKKAKELRQQIYGSEFSHRERLYLSERPRVDISRRRLYQLAKKFYKQSKIIKFWELFPKLSSERQQMEDEHKYKLKSFLDKQVDNFNKIGAKQASGFLLLLFLSGMLSACSARSDLVPCKLIWDCTNYSCIQRTTCNGDRIN